MARRCFEKPVDAPKSQPLRTFSQVQRENRKIGTEKHHQTGIYTFKYIEIGLGEKSIFLLENHIHKGVGVENVNFCQKFILRKFKKNRRNSLL